MWPLWARQKEKKPGAWRQSNCSPSPDRTVGCDLSDHTGQWRGNNLNHQLLESPLRSARAAVTNIPSSPVASALPGINRPFPIHQPLQLSIPQVHQSPPPPLSGIYRGAPCPLINSTVIVHKFCLHLTLLSVPIGIRTVNKARKREDILAALS